MPVVLLNDATKVLVDDEDYEWAMQWRWTRSGRRESCPGHPRAHPGYAMRGVTIEGRRLGRYMHREIAVRAGMIEAYDSVPQVDHRDRYHFNNQRSNLRATTHGGQSRNRVLPPGRSGIRGVQIVGQVWRVELRYEGQRYRKSFSTVEEAVAWRDHLYEQWGVEL